jgi:hypothetical protein
MLKFSALATFALGLMALPAHGQATVSGAATVVSGGELMTLSGQITLPDGFVFDGPTVISAYNDPNAPTLPNPLVPTTLKVLNIEPGFVSPVAPSTPAAIAAQQLSVLDANTQLADVISLIRASSDLDDTVTAASASGSVTYSNGTFVQTITGELTLQAGYFAGPLIVEQSPGTAGTPNATTYPISVAPEAAGLISSLVISPGYLPPEFGAVEASPNTLNAAVAAKLRQATDLDTQVSILRAGQYLLKNTGTNQSSATATTTITSIAGTTTGFSQSFSGQILLPNNLYFLGPDVETYTINPLTPAGLGVCAPGQGCLFVAPIFSSFSNFSDGIPSLEQLVFDAGPVAVITPALNLNAEAAVLLAATDTVTALSDVVSLIRAGTSAEGPAANSIQGGVSGAVTIITPEGGVQSVSASVTLPPGLYFNHELDGSCRNPSPTGSACLAVIPNILQNTGSNFELDSVAVDQLSLFPGLVLPGDPLGGAAVTVYDFNAQVALKVYQATDAGDLSNLVSLIRAGSGGSSSSGQPQAVASGAVSTVFTTGAVQSVSGEISLPPGQFFDGSSGCNTGTSQCVQVTPFYPVSDGTIASLTIDAGPGNTTVPLWTFNSGVAYAITSQTTVSDVVSVIRAAAGAQGLE